MEVAEPIQKLAKAVAENKRRRDELEKELEFLNQADQQLRTQLREQMEAAEISSFNVDGLGRFTISVRNYPRAVGDPEKAIQWFDEQGHPEVAPRTIAKARLKEIYDDLVENDKPLPPEDVVQVYRESTVRYTGVKA